MRLPAITVLLVITAFTMGTDRHRLTAAGIIRPNTDSLAGLNALTGVIDTSITLGAWLRARPSERVSDSIPSGASDDDICRTTMSQVTVAGRRATRFALFNVPNPPPNEELPQDTAAIAARACHLRALWVELIEPDSLRAHALARTIALSLDAELGGSVADAKIAGRGTANWLDQRTWTGPGTTVVLGISPPDYGMNSELEMDTAKVTEPRTVIIAAYTPFSGLDDLGSPAWDSSMADLTEEDEWGKKWYFDRVDSAIASVGHKQIASDLSLVMRRIRFNRYLDTIASAESEALVRAAAAIVRQAPSLPRARRAALLFAGDLVLVSAAPAFETGDTTTHHFRLFKALTAAGVKYGPEAYMVGRPYAREWLWEAYRLDSLGRTGHAAMLALLASGWQTSAGCEDNVDQIAQVIRHGEAAMRRGDIDPIIQYYVGMAYQDRFSLASGDYYQDYTDPAHWQPKAEESRILAIERLRTSLISLRPRHLRRDAWRTAMRLMLGRPSQPRYFCFDD